MAFIKTYKKYLKVSALILFICLAAFVLMYFLLIGPQNETQRNIETRLNQCKQEYNLAKIASKEENQVLIREEIGNLKNRLNDFVLDNKNAADLTFDISQIANECSLSSFNIQSSDVEGISESSDPNNVFEKSIKVSFMAGFEDFAFFLNTLERHKPVLFVNKFMLSRQNNSNTNYQVTVDLAALVCKQALETQEENVERVIGFNY